MHRPGRWSPHHRGRSRSGCFNRRLFPTVHGYFQVLGRLSMIESPHDDELRLRRKDSNLRSWYQKPTSCH
jgi:hypothetical protein